MISALTEIAFTEPGEFNSVYNQMITVPGGKMIRQSDDGRTRVISLNTFLMDRLLVTVKEFDDFAKTTGYITDAQRSGNAAVFDAENNGWQMTDGATYFYPKGLDKEKAPLSHPATQVSWLDAQAYAAWIGKQLPTENEWEWAAQNASNICLQYRYNEEPIPDSLKKQYVELLPAGSFGKNQLGFYDMDGTVRQWTTTSLFVKDQQELITKGGLFTDDMHNVYHYKRFNSVSAVADQGYSHIGFRCVLKYKSL
ncbi:SUMF1/EgtB/PvdO family nonheme iron enzyme [Solitalea canadensis]|uniref:Sulfatase-modifying factor enzyme-like domain-containing protein n=1 Tax=Solitalea canadensis (strain ATCC 29591 / DSM 3403 / JCM 21819 / LMG 8368 / NBRC 15130 / NCIMB 12057 / USAM 9D) TaxID=929556 RepID=H8KW92_SOLCM|nr:SUMF1/EgtB/PvdO family nonheme iron enzyme [Solitalea canadensis]AFD07884.1 hypothetical protein Solca_2860 [Solitalea canadensis DSM 3403]